MTAPIILNVDDHEPGRYARTRLLTQAGYMVQEAASGKKALELVSSIRPDLVLLDVNLPDLNGLEVCRQIKTNPSTAKTPVLHLSASAISAAERAGGLDNGADSYLIEPVDSQILLATVRALLRMRKVEEELRLANEALQTTNALLVRSNEDLQRFAYMASHDLQEPLRTVSSFASLLERRYGKQLDADAGQFLKHILAGTGRMISLIQGLLLYAQAGQEGEGSWGDVNTEEALAWALNNLERSISESQAVITQEPLPTVKGDQMQLAQLFQNLIGNALKYRRKEEAPRIWIGAESQSGGMARFSIVDNGVGISPEYRERIFAPFQRLQGRGVPGCGIGLATCQRIIERHGGRIWVESNPDSNGATFRFLLPLA